MDEETEVIEVLVLDTKGAPPILTAALEAAKIVAEAALNNNDHTPPAILLIAAYMTGLTEGIRLSQDEPAVAKQVLESFIGDMQAKLGTAIGHASYIAEALRESGGGLIQ